jgi:hypothetical protein
VVKIGSTCGDFGILAILAISYISLTTLLNSITSIHSGHSGQLCTQHTKGSGVDEQHVFSGVAFVKMYFFAIESR